MNNDNTQWHLSRMIVCGIVQKVKKKQSQTFIITKSQKFNLHINGTISEHYKEMPHPSKFQ